MLRGLDLNGVGLVINYELSFDKWEYYRRVSKTFRPYKLSEWSAFAINIINGSSECKILSEFQEFFNFQIEEIDYKNENVDIEEADPEDESDQTESIQNLM